MDIPVVSLGTVVFIHISDSKNHICQFRVLHIPSSITRRRKCPPDRPYRNSCSCKIFVGFFFSEQIE